MPIDRPPCRSHAFTLLELLTVIAILAILGGIGLGVIRSTKQRANISRAKAELSLLVQALEDYKRHYGDYPQTGPSAANSQRVTGTAGPGVNAAQARLFNALIGVYGPTNFNVAQNGPLFVDVTKLTLEIPFSTTAAPTSNLPTTFAIASGTPPAKRPTSNAFVDPWGNRYMYSYKTTSLPGRPPVAWNAPSFILYSTGPDGASTTLPSAVGIFSGTTQTTGDNADNLYADKLP
jgi:prepilin-type N-terminal cleavage/methylation domain-containing protein